nr:hypothetical protein [Cohnella terricola]
MDQNEIEAIVKYSTYHRKVGARNDPSDVREAQEQQEGRERAGHQPD